MTRRGENVSADPIRDIPHYLRLFQTYVGARMYLVFALTLLAALAEGFGIVMFLPLLQGAEGLQAGSTSGASRAVSDALAWLGVPRSTLALLLLIGTLFILKGALLFAAGAHKARLNAHLLHELKSRLYDDYCRMRLQYYASRDTGYFTNLMNVHIYSFLAAFQHMVALVAGAITTLIYFIVALAVAWQFGLMAMAIGAVLLFAFRKLGAYVRGFSRKRAQESGQLAHLLIQSLQSFKYLAATAQGKPIRDKVMRSIGVLSNADMRMGIANAFAATSREPLAVLAMLAIMIVQLVWFDQPLGPIMVSLVLFHRGLNTALSLQSTLQSALLYSGSVEMVRDEFTRQTAEREPDGELTIAPLSGTIELRNVSFAYGDEQDVIKDVSLEIPALSSVALVGESGSGKSTLADLLTLMLRPRKGQILIDGVSSERIKLESWRRQIGYVSQETVVFDDTLANNICLWRGDPATDADLFARIREAARKAHIAHFIEGLPEGYFTRVGDRGVRLSGGQRQRLFIARELFKQPNLLILDEATSALDSESERAIQESIDELKGQMTVVMIAHRLSTIRNVDHVYLFERGHLIEHGPYASLRNSEQSRFSKFVAMQAL